MKPTHRIELFKSGKKWNWHIIRIQNGEIVAYSNQNHSRKIDAMRTAKEVATGKIAL